MKGLTGASACRKNIEVSPAVILQEPCYKHQGQYMMKWCRNSKSSFMHFFLRSPYLMIGIDDRTYKTLKENTYG